MDNESRLSGKPAVAIGIYLSPGANAVQTATAVQKTLAKVGAALSEGPEVQGRLRFDDLRHATPSTRC